MITWNITTHSILNRIAGRHPSLISIFNSNDDIIKYVEKCDVWKVTTNLDHTKRGQLIEHYRAAREYRNLKHLGRLDKGKFPHWDFYDDVNNVMISQKSVKLPPAGKNKDQWTKELEKEIRDLSNQNIVDYSGKLPDGKVVTGFIKQLDIVIPSGMKNQYMKELNDLINYGKSNNRKIDILIKELL